MATYYPASQRELKLATSLHKKKFRQEEQLFIAEGEKVISELLHHFNLHLLFVTSSGTHLPFEGIAERTRVVTEPEMKRLSLLECHTPYLAIFQKRTPPPFHPQGLTVALHALQNPGNLGTIIRLCDWLGITNLLLGKGTVDPYNPKVVQATAGALGNLSVYEEVELTYALPLHFRNIIGTTLGGKPYYKLSLAPEELATSVLLFGNEGQGIAPQLLELCTTTLTIPAAPSSVGESLNVALSAAIILTHFTPKS